MRKSLSSLLLTYVYGNILNGPTGRDRKNPRIFQPLLQFDIPREGVEICLDLKFPTLWLYNRKD